MILVIVWAPNRCAGAGYRPEDRYSGDPRGICIGFIVPLVQSEIAPRGLVEGKKRGAPRVGQLGLDIANKTLPLFRHVNAESLRQVCDIIRRDIHADAVAITNIDHVLAYVGVGEHNYRDSDDTISPTTRQAINYGKIIIKQ